MRTSNLSNRFALGVLALLIAVASACTAPQERKVELQGSTPTARDTEQPAIVASPTEEGADGWRIASSDAVTLTITAPGASEVQLLYRPVIADEEDGYVQLKKLIEPTERASGKFQTNLQTSSDFAGDVWARISYPDGTTKQTPHVALTTRTALADNQTTSTNTAQTTNADANNQSANNANANNTNTSNANAGNVAKNTPTLGEDESARSDKATGGRVVRAALRPDNPDIRITVNVPAFKLTLWQNGKEVATYPVGVGRKKFPIPIGERTANKIILNPAWIPPDSEWVRESSNVEPYERIPASDERNPLGKIKIPLGDAYLLHEAQSPSDIGNLVSHGCVRVLREDLYDLTRKIAQARSIADAPEKIERARDGDERMVIDLGSPVPVDINYDSIISTLR